MYIILVLQCLETMNSVQKSLDKIGSKYARISAVWKKGIHYEYTHTVL